MGNCSGGESLPPHAPKTTSVNDWDSISYHDDREADMISLDRLFKSKDAHDTDDYIDSPYDGTTSSVTDGPMVEEDIASTSRAPATRKTDKKVTFAKEKDALEELFSEEDLLQKKRKSFGADMTLFSEMLKETNSNGHKIEV